MVKEALYDAFYKLTDSKSQVSKAADMLKMVMQPIVLLYISLQSLKVVGVDILCTLQIKSYVFDVVRGTVPKINLDDVFTVTVHPDTHGI